MLEFLAAQMRQPMQAEDDFDHALEWCGMFGAIYMKSIARSNNCAIMAVRRCSENPTRRRLPLLSIHPDNIRVFPPVSVGVHVALQ
jgi:hypothetical protein